MAATISPNLAFDAALARIIPPGTRYEGIPADKTPREALIRAIKRREHIWYSHEWMLRPEDERIDELERFCIALCGGNTESGNRLATDALWEPGQ